MALTADQIAKRRYSIGSSDAPSVCGVNPWRTAYDVWLEKTGRIDGFTGNDATRAGDLLEASVVRFAIERLRPTEFNFGVELVAKDLPFVTATLDARAALDTGDKCVIEAKTGGICSPLQGEWGEPETDEIPERYMVQVQHQLFVAGEDYQFAVVSALIPPRGFVLYYVPRDNVLIGAIVEKEIAFWECVQTDTPPDDSVPSMDAIKRRRREPNKVVEVDPALIAMYQDAQKKAKAAEEYAEEVKAILLATLGDAEAGDAGEHMVTYYESERKGYTVQPTTFRQLRIKKGKR
jgi:putative phage-type endonuclease